MTFVTLNRFCPLSKTPPSPPPHSVFLTGNIEYQPKLTLLQFRTPPPPPFAIDDTS